MRLLKILLMVLILATALVGCASPNITVVKSTESKHDTAELAKQGMKFDVPDSPAQISPEQAVKKVIDAGMGKKNSEVYVEYQLLSDTRLKAEKLPVYIVSLKGVQIRGSDGSIKQELNGVVDANTGKVLWGFTYR